MPESPEPTPAPVSASSESASASAAGAQPERGGLPRGFTVELGRRVRVFDGGRTLVGGAPPRVAHLSDKARSLLRGRRLRADDAASQRLADRLLGMGLADPVPAELPPVELSALTVVVPVRDRPRELDRLLAALGGKVRAIVVDDESEHPEAVARVAARHDAELVALPRNVGPAGARNAGLARVRTPYVAFVDSDVVAEPEALALLLRHFQDPKVAAVAPRVLGLDETATANWISRYEAARSSLDLGPIAAPVHPRSLVGWVPSACLVARVSALGEGYAEGMRVGEDVDLVWRLGAAGWVIRYEPSVVVTHPCRPDFAGWLHQRVQYGRSAAPLAERHGTAGAPLQLSGWSALAWGAVLVGHPLLGAGVAAGTTAALVPKLGGLDDPVGESLRLAGLGHLWAGRAVAEALRRPWWPLALALAAGHRRARPAVAAAMVVPPLLEWRERRPALDPVRWTALRLADDFAYGLGVWQGALKARSLRSLLPRFTGPLRRPGPA